MGSIKKSIRFWKQYEDGIISKGAKTIIKRLKRAQNRNRAKSGGK